jgi:hypothetical protein
VRQTIMLQSKLQEARGLAAARVGNLRARVLRIVRHAIEDERDEAESGEDVRGEAERGERLCAEAAEGLEQERWGDLLTRPVGEIVAEICKDLGLRPDWRGLQAGIAAAEAFARGDKDAADVPEEDEECVLYWLGEDGRPTPAPGFEERAARASRRRGYYDPAYDPALRRDTS